VKMQFVVDALKHIYLTQ